MDNYQKLYNQVVELQEKYKIKENDINLSIDSYNKSISENDTEIRELNYKIKHKKTIYSTLVNYKEFMISKVKSNLKFSGIVSTVIGIIMLIVGLLTSLVTKTFLYQDILFSLVISGVVGVVLGITNFLEDTKEVRRVHKEYKNQIYAFPVMIATLDKQLQIEHEIKTDFQEKIDALNVEKTEVMNVLKECQAVIGYLISRMTEERQFGRSNIKMLNQVFESDERAQEALKLVREKKNDVDTE